MTDDLAKRLRKDWTPIYGGCVGTMFEAADRIEQLEAALLEIFDHECRASDRSFIACTARDALWPRAALEGKDD